MIIAIAIFLIIVSQFGVFGSGAAIQEDRYNGGAVVVLFLSLLFLVAGIILLFS